MRGLVHLPGLRDLSVSRDRQTGPKYSKGLAKAKEGGTRRRSTPSPRPQSESLGRA
jgi:hypothetical protein